MNNNNEQDSKDIFVSLLGLIGGAKVIPAKLYIKSAQKQQQLKTDIDSLKKDNLKLLMHNFKLYAYVEYRRKWRLLTKSIEKRTQKLEAEGMNKLPANLPKDLQTNLAEAYQCYIMNLKMACYMVVLRSIELAASHIYDKHNLPQFQSNGKQLFIAALTKLNWLEKNGYIKGLDFRIAKAVLESRNETIHEVHEPDDQELLSAFRVVLKLIDKLSFN